VISADRGYFDEVIAEGGLDETEISFPGSYQQRSVRLSGTEMRIGRRSASRGITPSCRLTPAALSVQSSAGDGPVAVMP
jgi:hypothetical protein